MEKSPEQEVEHYLRTGERDGFYWAWPGENLFARAKRGDSAMRKALIPAVRSRTAHATVPKELAGMDVAGFTRKKVEPMVRGLFPGAEQETVLGVLERSAVFLSPAVIDKVLSETPWPSTAWNLANLYLASYGVELLSGDAPRIVGLSLGTTCYVSADYFRAQERFEDFVLHEAAHIFHNCKRRTAGLREIRGREWLLDIGFGKRETFAYACETYGRLLERAHRPAARRMLLLEIENGPMPPDDGVDPGEYVDILHEAVAARNGWKRILERCSPCPKAGRGGTRAA
jgi:hypothetical protein